MSKLIVTLMRRCGNRNRHFTAEWIDRPTWPKRFRPVAYFALNPEYLPCSCNRCTRLLPCFTVATIATTLHFCTSCTFTARGSSSSSVTPVILFITLLPWHTVAANTTAGFTTDWVDRPIWLKRFRRMKRLIIPLSVPYSVWKLSYLKFWTFPGLRSVAGYNSVAETWLELPLTLLYDPFWMLDWLEMSKQSHCSSASDHALLP